MDRAAGAFRTTWNAEGPPLGGQVKQRSHEYCEGTVARRSVYCTARKKTKEARANAESLYIPYHVQAQRQGTSCTGSRSEAWGIVGDDYLRFHGWQSLTFGFTKSRDVANGKEARQYELGDSLTARLDRLQWQTISNTLDLWFIEHECGPRRVTKRRCSHTATVVSN